MTQLPADGGEKPGLRRALSALQFHNYRQLYIASMVSAMGGQFQATANLWQIYELTASPFQLGLTGLARALPVLALALIGGVVADRVDRRKFIMVTQVLNGLISLALGVLTATGHIAVWHIYAASFLGGAVSSLGQPARMAIVPTVVPRDHLMNAIALNSTVWQSSSIVGPALGGLSIGLLGLAISYAWNGLAQIASIISVSLIHIPPVSARPRGSPVRSLIEGLGFVRTRPIILTLVVLDLGVTLFGNYRALWPVIATDLGVGPEGMGVLQAAPGVGSLIGVAVLMSLGDVRYKGLIAVGGVLAYPGALVILAHSTLFALSMGIAGCLGLCDAVQGVTRSTVIQAVVPDELRGRVSSFQSMLTQGGPGLGQTLSGATASLLGVPGALTVGATLAALLALGLGVTQRELRVPGLGGKAEFGVFPGHPPAPFRAPGPLANTVSSRFSAGRYIHEFNTQ